MACVIWGAAPNIAPAQQIIANSQDFASQAEAVQESVNNQPRPEYQPVGIRLGQFLGVGDGPFDRTASEGTLAPLSPGAEPNASALRLRDSALDSFLLQPRLEMDFIHDDNLFRLDRGVRSDNITVLRPTLSLASDWLNHGVVATIGGELGRYQDFSGEDYEDYFLSFDPLVGPH